MKFSSLPILLKLYIGVMVVLGALAFWATLLLPAPNSPQQPQFWLTLALIATTMVFSTWKVRLTIHQSEMTLTSAVVCLAMLLQWGVAALLCAAVGASIGTVVRSVPGRWHPTLKWPEFYRLAFNVANCVVASAAAAYSYWVVETWMAQRVAPGLPAWAAGAMAFQFAQFIFNTMGLSVALALLKGHNTLKVWKENFLWTGPGYFASASVAVGIYAAYTQPVIGPISLLFLGPLYFIYVSYRVYMDRMNLYVQKVEQDMRHIQELNELNSAIIASLATAIDAKDRYTRSHINRVQMYAVALAEAAGLSGPELEAVRTGALIHDIGKLGIPERILGKPGKLTPEEFRRMQAHVTIGAEILAPVKFPYPVLPIVLTHHERWDGHGYPKGLKGPEIPMGGRIMAIADVFDALTSNRPYRMAMSFDDALNVLREGAGKQFDPLLVEQFAVILPEIGSRVQQADWCGTPGLGEPGAAPEKEENWAFSQISQAAAEMSATCELAQGLAETSTVREVVTVVTDRALRLLPVDTAVVYLCDEESGELYAEAIQGLYADKLAGLRISRGEGVSGWVAETLQGQINAQASLDIARRFNPNEQMELSAAAAVPLVQGSTTFGVLTLYTTGYSVLNEHHLGVMNILAEHAAAALGSARRYELTRELSLTDPLTGLPNSRSLFHHVEALCARWRGREESAIPDRFTVLMFDLDGFKTVNDTGGHLRGDQLLGEFGEILRRLSRDGDLPCRYAGDEFVVVLVDTTAEQAQHFARRVRQVLDQKAEEWLPTPLGVSVGTACFPQDGQDGRTLLAVADERMYNDKFQRRGSPVRG